MVIIWLAGYPKPSKLGLELNIFFEDRETNRSREKNRTTLRDIDTKWVIISIIHRITEIQLEIHAEIDVQYTLYIGAKNLNGSNFILQNLLHKFTLNSGGHSDSPVFLVWHLVTSWRISVHMMLGSTTVGVKHIIVCKTYLNIYEYLLVLGENVAQICMAHKYICKYLDSAYQGVMFVLCLLFVLVCCHFWHWVPTRAI